MGRTGASPLDRTGRGSVGPHLRASARLLCVLECENLCLAGVDFLLCDGVAQRGPVSFVGFFERCDLFVELGHGGGCGALDTDPVVEFIAQIGVFVR